MPRNAIIIGALLFALGPIFYALGEPGHQSLTSFIPSLFGILIAAFGMVARTPSRLKTGMHGAAGVALLGVLGSLRGAPVWPLILSGQGSSLTHNKLLAGWSTLLFFTFCLLLVAMSVQSFRAARRAAR